MGSFDNGLGGIPGRRDEEYRRGEDERLRRQEEERRQRQERDAANERERQSRQRQIDDMNRTFTGRGGPSTPSPSKGGSSKPSSGFGKLAMLVLGGFFIYSALQNDESPDGSQSQQPVGDMTPLPLAPPPPAPPTSWEVPLDEKPTEQSVLTKGLQLFLGQVVTVPTTERMRDILVDQVFDGLDKTPFGQVRFGAASLAPMLQVTVMSAPINSGIDLTHAFLCAVEPGRVIKLVSMKYSDGMVRLTERVSKDGDVIDLAEIASETKSCMAAFSTLDARASVPPVDVRTPVSATK